MTSIHNTQLAESAAKTRKSESGHNESVAVRHDSVIISEGIETEKELSTSYKDAQLTLDIQAEYGIKHLCFINVLNVLFRGKLC